MKQKIIINCGFFVQYVNESDLKNILIFLHKLLINSIRLLINLTLHFLK